MIADRLGHSSVRTVLDVYGHLYEGADEAAAERLDEQIASYASKARPGRCCQNSENEESPAVARLSVVGVDGLEPPTSSL